MEEPRDPEALRRRLYQPGAAAEDLDAYARARPGDGIPATERSDGGDRTGPARVRVVVAAAAGGLAAVLIGVAVLSGLFAPSEPHVAAIPSSTAPRALPSASAATADGAGTTSGPDTTGFLVVTTAPTDTGRRPGARGAARESGPGVVEYTVARGDSVSGVAARFSVCRSDVLLALPYGFDWPDVRPGQVLVLSRSGPGAPDATC